MVAHIFHGASPGLFERWLRRAVSVTVRINPRAPLVFVNSWNEWAEGAHLEPDERTGDRYLGAVRRAVTTDGGRLADGACHDGSIAAAQQRHTGAIDHPVGPIRAGLPRSTRDAIVTDGVVWIERVDGRPFDACTIAAVRGQVVSLGGWLVAHAGPSATRGGQRFLVLSSGGVDWHAPIRQHRRPELMRGVLGSGRRFRRVVRVIDRLPRRLGSIVFSLAALGRGPLGFEVGVPTGSLPPGTYEVAFIAPVCSSPWRLDTAYRLVVTDGPSRTGRGPVTAQASSVQG